MPRENSFSDGPSERSLTPDLPKESTTTANNNMDASGATAVNPTSPPERPRVQIASNARIGSVTSPRTARAKTPAGDKFRAVVKRVMSMHRTRSQFMVGNVGAEPGQKLALRNAILVLTSLCYHRY